MSLNFFFFFLHFLIFSINFSWKQAYKKKKFQNSNPNSLVSVPLNPKPILSTPHNCTFRPTLLHRLNQPIDQPPTSPSLSTSSSHPPPCTIHVGPLSHHPWPSIPHTHPLHSLPQRRPNQRLPHHPLSNHSFPITY